MNIRAMFERDLPQVKRIHEKFYEKEFSFEDFASKYLSSFIVHDDNGEIITAGGVRTIAEVVLVTDKDRSVRERKDALVIAQNASKYIAGNTGHDIIVAFIQDDDWLKHLMKVGFDKTKGISIFSPVNVKG